MSGNTPEVDDWLAKTLGLTAEAIRLSGPGPTPDEMRMQIAMGRTDALEEVARTLEQHDPPLLWVEEAAAEIRGLKDKA
jgi:hypothetical protein